MSGLGVVMAGALDAVADSIMDNIRDKTDRMYQTKYNWRGAPIEGGQFVDYPNNHVFRAVVGDGTFCIAGEGATMALAEEDAYTKWQAYLACTKHEFERGKFKNGGGICKNCQCIRADVFEPLTLCKMCQMPTTYQEDKAGDFWCEHHVYSIPIEAWTDKMWRRAYTDHALRELRAHMNNAYVQHLGPKINEPDGMLLGYPLVYLSAPTTSEPTSPDNYDASVAQVL